jgi:hypothetical protein
MTHFTVEQTAEILDLPPSIVDKLVRSGQLPSNGSGVPASEIQSYLSQSFIRLFQAQAKEPVPVMLPEPEPELQPQPAAADTVIIRSIAEYEDDMRGETPDLRIAPRYVPRRQLGGTFRDTRFTLLQLSTTGLRIRHDETLRPGDLARLTLALQRPARTFAMQARVVWTSIAQRGDGPTFCISGLRVIDAGPLQQVIHHLREARDLQADEGRRRRESPLSGLTDEEVASIIRVVRRFNADPVEAGRWYTRARFSLADEQIRAAAPQRARDREEVVGVWECLDRKLDIGKIATVVTWLRQTRGAAAEAQLAM